MSDTSPILEKLLSDNRDRLRQMIRLRIDRRLAPRVDASDIVQEAFTEAALRFEKFQEDDNCSGFVWLRFLTLQKLAQLHRHHVGVQARSVLKEDSPRNLRFSPASSIVLAEQFVDENTTPPDAAVNSERKQQIASAIESLPESDREILAMRHFEDMTNAEVAEALEIESATAYKRYVRALQRFKTVIAEQDD